MDVEGQAFRGEGFDPTERAFVVARSGPDGPAPVVVTLRATPDSPIMNPVLRIRSWDAAIPRVEIGGRPAVAGREIRAGLIPGLEGDDLVLWIRRESTSPIRISISPPRSSAKGEVR